MLFISINIQTANNKLNKIASVNGSELEKNIIVLSLNLSFGNSPYQIDEKVIDLMLISNDGNNDINLYLGNSSAFALKSGECFSGLLGINSSLSVETLGIDEVPLRIIYTKQVL